MGKDFKFGAKKGEFGGKAKDKAFAAVGSVLGMKKKKKR